MGIWKNKDKRKMLERGHRREIKSIYDEPQFKRVETLEDKELDELVKEIQEQKPNKE